MPLLNDTAMYADYIFPSLSFLEAEASAAGAAPLKAYMKAIHAGDAIINAGQEGRRPAKGTSPGTAMSTW